MKLLIIGFLLVSFSLSLHGQDIFDIKYSGAQRQQDLLNFIKGDIELYSHYKSGNRNLKTAKVFGITSIVFLVADVGFIFGAAASNDFGTAIGFAALFVLSSLVASITGIVGLVLRSKGKGKIRDVMDYARGELRKEHTGGWDLKMKNNGVALVYNF